MLSRTGGGARLDRIRAARAEQDLSQAELADRVGRPQSTISLIERGQVRLHASLLEPFAQALNLDPSELDPEGVAQTARLFVEATPHIPHLITELLEERGMTITDLAQKSGVALSTTWSFVTGESTTLSLAQPLAQALGMTRRELIEEALRRHREDGHPEGEKE